LQLQSLILNKTKPSNSRQKFWFGNRDQNFSLETLTSLVAIQYYDHPV